MCRMSTKTFFIACLLAVCIRADESACDCSSEAAKVTQISSQVTKLEGELETSKSNSKQFEQQLSALKSSSQKSEADLQNKAKELEASKKKVQELETSQATSQKTEADLQNKAKELEASKKKVQELEASQANSQKTEADLQKKVKELEGSHASSGKRSETEINSLKLQVKELSEKLENAQKSKEEAASALQECGEISMMGFASKVGSMTNGVVKRALEQTDLDEKLATQVHAHVGTATGAAGMMATNLKDRIASVNYTVYYTDVMERLSSSKAYQTVTDTVAEKTQSLRPHIEMARVTLEPTLTKAKDMAGPTWAKAQPTLEKAKTKALETYVAGAAAVQTHVLPVLKKGGSSALDQVSALALAQLEKIMTPLFDAIAKAAPEHASTLPTHAVDRALFLLVVVVLAYYSLYFVRVALRIALRLTARTSLMSLRLFKLVVMIPLRILLYLIDFTWWVATLFYCCGLCRRKKQAAKLKAKAKTGPKENAQPDANKLETVTAAECQALFEKSKEKNKVDEGAKQLAKFVKEKKPMKATSVQGKILTKEVFEKTCKKFNVNIKKLDL